MTDAGKDRGSLLSDKQKTAHKALISYFKTLLITEYESNFHVLVPPPFLY